VRKRIRGREGGGEESEREGGRLRGKGSKDSERGGLGWVYEFKIT